MAARGPGDPEGRRRRHVPPGLGDRPRHGRLGLRIGLLAVLGRGRADVRARRRHRPLQDLLGRHAADRVREVGGAGRRGRLRLAALARGAPRGRLLRDVRLRSGPRRQRRRRVGGQRGVALRAQRDGRPAVAAHEILIKGGTETNSVILGTPFITLCLWKKCSVATQCR